MPNQSDFERINRLVIQPLAIAYGTRYPEPMIDAMINDLADFDDACLERAVVEVRRTRKLSPSIAHIVEACVKVGGKRVSSIGQHQNFYSVLKRRDEDAHAMARRFMAGFDSLPIAAEAKAGGWYNQAERYASECALLQARYMTDVANPGFSLIALTDAAKVPMDQVDRIRGRFIAFCKRQADTGTIAVDFPADLIELWKPKAVEAA